MDLLYPKFCQITFYPLDEDNLYKAGEVKMSTIKLKKGQVKEHPPRRLESFMLFVIKKGQVEFLYGGKGKPGCRKTVGPNEKQNAVLLPPGDRRAVCWEAKKATVIKFTDDLGAVEYVLCDGYSKPTKKPWYQRLLKASV